MSSLYHSLSQLVLNIVFPRICLNCRTVENYLCKSCIPHLERISPICPICTKPALDGETHPRCRTRYTIDGLTCTYRYTGPVRKAIKLLKYRRVRDIAAVLSLIMLKEITPANKAKTTTLDGNNRDHGSMIQTTLLHNPVLVPIPLHWWRERQRWFNQSELLAREIGTQLSLAVQTDILIRSKKTAPQAGKKRAERMRSMQGVFTLQTLKKHQKLPHSIILLDDVWTTGATMREAARTLKRAGVTQVWGLTLAG